MKRIKRDIVAALIFSKDGKLFQGMKDPNKGGVYSDSWHIPGGGIDQGEDKESALIREVKEETGIDISLYEIELVDDSGRGECEKTLKGTGEDVVCEMVFNVFKIVINDKNADEIEIKLEDDLVTHSWTQIDELKKLKLTPPSIKLFKKLGYLK